MDHLKGWKIELRAAYGSRWDRARELRPGADFCLWESPDGAIAALLYQIMEIGVSKEIGRLAVFRNKEKPEMLFNFQDLRCWYWHQGAAQFGKDELLFAHRFQEEPTGRLSSKICALDLAARRFALVDSLPGNFYDINHVDGRKYLFETKGCDGSMEKTTLDLDGLRWRALSDWSDFHPDAAFLIKTLRLPYLLWAGLAAWGPRRRAPRL